jgi:hypothetical protein
MGNRGSRSRNVIKFMSTAVAHEIVWRHRAADVQLHPPPPAVAEILDHPLELTDLAVLDEEGDVHGVQFVGRYADAADV